MKVSIIIPVYNVSAYIERCIKSVINQTYQDIECILINDASPDDSATIAEHLITSYAGPIQFKILYHEHNKGVSAARNTGINIATGDYLYFLDSDDEITPDCIETLSRPILNNSTIEMVEGCYKVISIGNEKDSSEQFLLRPQLEFSSQKAVRTFYFSRQYENKLPVNKLVKRDFLLKNQLFFNIDLRWGEDDFWHFHYNKFLNHLYIIPDITYKYYKHPNSLTTTPKKEYRNQVGHLYAKIANNISSQDGVREVKYFLKGFCLFYVDGPTTPVYKQVACHFLKVLKDNHCIKEWLLLKSVILLSKWTLTRKIIKKTGEILRKNNKKQKNTL